MLLLQTYSNQYNHNKKPLRKRIYMIIFILLSILLIGGISSYFYLKSLTQPVNIKDTRKVAVDIPIGSSTSGIGHILKEKSVIRNSTFFALYARYKHESKFQAGNYLLSPSMGLDQILKALHEGKIYKAPGLRMTIPEGWNVPQVAAEVSKKTGVPKADILKTMNDKTFIKQLQKKYPVLGNEIFQPKIYYPLEGYLFPATYEFQETKPQPKQIIEEMVKKANAILLPYQPEMKKNGFTIFQALDLASVIEEESQRTADRPKISGVFHNRLKLGMKLDSDPTVKYARKNFRVKVLYQDLTFNSPYNTYRFKGLPIGPIASPGEKSIIAALHPAKIDALFFFARPDGEVIYTKTLAEHTKVINKYMHEWDVWNKR